jgi:hypothetical protein
VLAGVGATAASAITAGSGAVGTGAAAAAAAPAEPAPDLAAQAPPASSPADGTGVLAPWVATGCRIAIGITMAFMLLIIDLDA